MTSWRHVIASQNLIYLSQLRDVLKSWFFCNGFWKSLKMLSILSNFNCLMSWCHDVMLWRHKTWFIIYLSQLVDVLESWFFFLFPWFVGSTSSKLLLIIYLFEVVTSRRHVMTTQTLMYLSQHADVLEKWFFFAFCGFLGHWVWKCYWILFVQCCDVMTSYHDVTKPDLRISACRCPRKMIIFLFPCFLGNWVQNWQRFLLYDVVMSWRHVMTSQSLLHLSRLVNGLERWFLLCFHGLTGCWFRECYHSCIFVMTSRP